MAMEAAAYTDRPRISACLKLSSAALSVHVKIVAARFYATAAALISDCTAALTTGSRSGLSVKEVTGVQLRV